MKMEDKKSNLDEEIINNIFDHDNSTMWQPSEKIPTIVNEIEKLKIEMKAYLDNCEFNVSDLEKESAVLCTKSEVLISELENCKQEIEIETMSEILKSIREHSIISEDLDRVQFSLNIIYDVIQSAKYTNEYEDYRKNNNYTRAVETLTDLTDFLNNPTEGFQLLTMYGKLKSSVVVQWDYLLQELNERWDKMLSWSKETCGRRETVHIDIKITETEPDAQSCFAVLQALVMCKQLNNKIAIFASFLLNQVLVPIIHQDCTVFEETDELMTITIPIKSDKKPPYDAVIANMRLLFHFLSKKLNIAIEAQETMMSILGKEISSEFGDILIRDCLVETIPNSISELQNYGRVTSEIEEFQKFLTMIGFFPSENFSILRYANNLDVLFANKTSQYFLESARGIMLKDLSSSMSIGVESVPEFPIKNVPVDETKEEALKIFDKAIPKSLFYFPRCMISRTAQELLNLVHVMMEQAVQCSDLVCMRLYATTRLVFELYDAVVPYHHENFLLTIPQYVALFHNNCMYLAHNLLTLGEKWMALLEERQTDRPISFIDLVQKIRDLGYKHLTIHMQQQRKQILDNIRSSDLNCIVMKDVLDDSAELAIRQCIRQLQLLKNVWMGVFPTNVFTRLMACLVNMFMEEMIHRVCTVEDISAEMATQLTEIYTIVVKKAPNLFLKESDIAEHVKSWIKLQELILVLGGSLKDIEKRWKDGSGPLAVHFKTDELRSLIKALFQNTQFRANLLSKIK